MILQKAKRLDRLRSKRSKLRVELADIENKIKTLTDELVSELRDDHPPTEREQQVLQLVRIGKSDKEIADTLHISYRTVKFHMSKLIHKAGVKRRYEL